MYGEGYKKITHDTEAPFKKYGTRAVKRIQKKDSRSWKKAVCLSRGKQLF